MRNAYINKADGNRGYCRARYQAKTVDGALAVAARILPVGCPKKTVKKLQ
jgi:hypothetical protein